MTDSSRRQRHIGRTEDTRDCPSGSGWSGQCSENACRDSRGSRGDEADLEDLLQEVAMRLIGHIQTLREESNLRAWLRAVAVNVARSAGRASRTSRVTSSDALDQIGVLDAPASPGDGGPGEGESDGSIMSLVEALPDLYREPLILRAVHGMRTRQIAVVLDLPPATIDTRIARARRMLRDRQLTGGHTS
ncbi:MAG: RNA polymerase sigma factor [Planctomycetota bacterium]